jgi:hypothetical protein
LDELNETFKLSAKIRTVAGTSEGIGTIVDDDAAPTFTLAASPNPVPEAATTTVTATLAAASGQAVTIPIVTANGTATSGTDYTAIGAGNIAIAAGQTTGTITVTTLTDLLDEVNETFTVTGNAGGANTTVTGTQVVTVTITDDDATPTISIGAPTPSSVVEGADLTFPVTLSAASGNAVTVTVTTSGSATSGSDYTAVVGTVTILAGATTPAAPLVVDTLDDSENEADTETVSLTLSAPVNASLGTATSTGSITDDADTTPAFSVAAVSVNEGAGTATITIRTAAPVTGDAAFIAATSVADPLTAEPADLTGALSTLAPVVLLGESEVTFTQAITDDAVYEGNETFTVTVTENDTEVVGGPHVATVTIVDNDNYYVTFVGRTVAEGESVEIDARVTGTTENAIPVNVTIAGASSGGSDAAEASDFTAVSTAFTWTIPAATVSGTTITSTVLSLDDDTIDEATETIVVSGTGATLLSILRGVVRITDTDDSASFTIGNRYVNENVGTTTVPVTLTYSGDTTSTEHGVTVRYATVNGTAVSGRDYNSRTGTLTFTGRQVYKTIPLTIINDRVDEATYETFYVRLGTVTPSRVIKRDDTGAIRITDNDAGRASSLNSNAEASDTADTEGTIDSDTAGTEDSTGTEDTAGTEDGGPEDSDSDTAGTEDAGPEDSETEDTAGTEDAEAEDAGTEDAGTDDADAEDTDTEDTADGDDAGTEDADTDDAGTEDADSDESDVSTE